MLHERRFVLGRIATLHSIIRPDNEQIDDSSIPRARTILRERNRNTCDSAEAMKRADWRYPRTEMCIDPHHVDEFSCTRTRTTCILTYDRVQRLKIGGRLQSAGERVELIERHFSQLRNHLRQVCRVSSRSLSLRP